MSSKLAEPRAALVIGGTRGVGLAVTTLLIQNQWAVVATYNRHYRQATRGLEPLLKAAPQRLLIKQLDIASDNVAEKFVSLTPENLCAVVVSVAGGMERDADETYAHRVNIRGPIRIARCLSKGAKHPVWLVLLTSHEAHFFGRKPAYSNYEHIARVKHRGERALTEAAEYLKQRQVYLKVVSSDIITNTSTAKLLEQRDPGLLDRQMSISGFLPTTEDVAEHVVRVVSEAPADWGGLTDFVGSTRAYTKEANEW